MSVKLLVVWGLLLLAQNASFTMVSRARNSGSYLYHASAAVLSNGVWFTSMFIVVDVFDRIRDAGPGSAFAVGMLLFYTACTVAASVGMHWFLIHFVERGKRKVGA